MSKKDNIAAFSTEMDFKTIIQVLETTYFDDLDCMNDITDVMCQSNESQFISSRVMKMNKEDRDKLIELLNKLNK